MCDATAMQMCRTYCSGLMDSYVNILQMCELGPAMFVLLLLKVASGVDLAGNQHKQAS